MKTIKIIRGNNAATLVLAMDDNMGYYIGDGSGVLRSVPPWLFYQVRAAAGKGTNIPWGGTLHIPENAFEEIV